MNKLQYIFSRIAAIMTDWSLMLLLLLIPTALLSVSLTSENLFSRALIIIVMILIIPVLVQTGQSYLLSGKGGSLGKLVFGLRVVDEKDCFLNLPYSFFRTFIGPIIGGLLLGLGYIWIILDDQNRGWHDLATGSRVRQTIKNPVLGVCIWIILILTNIYLVREIGLNIQSNPAAYAPAVDEFNLEMNKLERSEKSQSPEKITPTPTPFVYPDNSL